MPHPEPPPAGPSPRAVGPQPLTQPEPEREFLIPEALLRAAITLVGEMPAARSAGVWQALQRLRPRD